jgi:hypothetical protein
MDTRKDCCKVESNLQPHVEPNMRPDVTAKKCVVCGCRHFEATIDAMQIGLAGAKVG